MNYDKLQELILKNLSTYEIAKEMGCSQTNIRYWLRKFGLNTNNLSQLKELKNVLNGLNCLCCGKELCGQKKLYCSDDCKSKYTYKTQYNTNARQKLKSSTRKIKLITMAGGSCVSCGYNKNYSALQFHHRDPENKTFNLDSRMLSNTNWDSILKEFKKCDLLCANCHFELHNPDKNLIGATGIEPAIHRL